MEYILTLFLFAADGAFITKTNMVMADRDMCHREQRRWENRQGGVTFAACNPRASATVALRPEKIGL